MLLCSAECAYSCDILQFIFIELPKTQINDVHVCIKNSDTLHTLFFLIYLEKHVCSLSAIKQVLNNIVCFG